ncbi:MAG: non-canonical purine NTP pyrophosphatase [Polyangiaceae bacterium]
MLRHRLVVATGNRGKLDELRVLLGDLPLDVQGVGEILREPPWVVEDGATFADNAMKKARAVADATMCLCLADDSGLEVDALGGGPGVHSARFAHARASDAENNAALLAALDARSAWGGAHRGPGVGAGLAARFRCALALVDPFDRGRPRIAEGVCEGSVLREPRGSGGFGYDPLFLVGGQDRTMAELSADEKNRVSHRAAAIAALRPEIELALAHRATLPVGMTAP